MAVATGQELVETIVVLTRLLASLQQEAARWKELACWHNFGERKWAAHCLADSPVPADIVKNGEFVIYRDGEEVCQLIQRATQH